MNERIYFLENPNLRGHNGDVLDLAWGPGDVVLATASVDNSIIIWNAERLPEQITILRGHTSLVKGMLTL